jgi:hypothetical protein
MYSIIKDSSGSRCFDILQLSSGERAESYLTQGHRLLRSHSGDTAAHLFAQLRAPRIRHFNSLGFSSESVDLAAPSRDHFTLGHFHEVFAGRRPKRTFQTEPTQQANLRLLRLLPAKREQDQLDAVGNS